MTKTKTKIGMVSAISAILLLAVIMPSMPFATADKATVCTDGDVLTGTYDNIVVTGTGIGLAKCVISGATVNGDVKQLSGKLDMGFTDVKGDIHTNGGSWTSLWFVNVDGEVHIKGLFDEDFPTGDHATDGFNHIAITGSTIGGDVKIHHNSINWLVMGFLSGNTVDGEVHIFQNSVNVHPTHAIPTDPVAVMGNTIGGDLNCKKNTGDGLPFTNHGVPNLVSGDTKHQCDGL